MLRVCAMLLPVLLLGHLPTAAMQVWHGDRKSSASGQALKPPVSAAGAAVTVLALLGTAPLWLGPAAELLSERHPGAIDTLVAVSPITHLAVASGLDILHSPWLYQHSNLAALPVNYPDPASLAAFYALACASGLAALAWAWRGQAPDSQTSDLEKT